MPTNVEGGEYYPIFTSDIFDLAVFGLGISVYYMQLLLLCFIYIIGTIILIPAMMAYTKPDYGIKSNIPYVSISAACENSHNVTATVGCLHNHTSCEIQFRPNCELTIEPPLAVYFMLLVLSVLTFMKKYSERYIKIKLDEAVQTTQDYSVMVSDPDEDATDPNEWFKFFSRFGTVRYVTITRKNFSLRKILLKRHLLLRLFKKEERDKILARNKNEKLPIVPLHIKILQYIGYHRDRDYYILKLNKLNEKLNEALKQSYPTRRY